MTPDPAETPTLRGIVVTDFDGTMSRTDFYKMVLGTLVPAEAADHWDEYWAGRVSHFDALRHIFSQIRGTSSDFERAMEGMDFDPRISATLARLGRHGWAVVVTSAGCAWYIERLFARAGLRWIDGGRVDRSAPAPGDLILHSNPGEVGPDGALLMKLPATNPFFDPNTGIDKPGIVRWALSLGVRVVFAGDGKPDEAPALLVPDGCRFARGWLAEKLSADRVPFTAIDRWSEIADHLLAEETRS